MKFRSILVKHGSSASFSPTKHFVDINLYKLILSIGTLQSSRVSPTNKQKFEGAADNLDWIDKTASDLVINIQRANPDAKRRVSESIGSGLAVEITSSLFKIDRATVAPIPSGKKMKPDFQCWSHLNKKIVVEAKGSFSKTWSSRQLKRAVLQKLGESADIRAASCSILEANKPVTCTYRDPKPDHDVNPLESRIAAAIHYSNAFNFIGQGELSRYFASMGKRLEKNGSIDFPEFREKNETFEDLRSNGPHITDPETGSIYLGRIDRISDDTYIFSGFDARLLSYAGFKETLYLGVERIFSLGGNKYFVTADGICLGSINNLAGLNLNPKQEGQIKHYQDYTTIVDIIEGSEIETRRYLEYILEKSGFQIANTQINEARFDLLVNKGNIRAAVEIKRFSHQNVRRSVRMAVKQIRAMSANYPGANRIILVTNVTIPDDMKEGLRDIIVLDKPLLKKVIAQPTLLLEIIG